MAPDSSASKTIVGRVPTAADRAWLKLADEDVLSPEKSLDRLDSYAKWLIGSVSLVGTALTGFGVFGSETVSLLRTPWILLPISLFCLSLALTVMGIIPQVGEVKPHEINSIRAYYKRLFRWRAFSLTIAGYLLAASLAAIPFSLFMKNARQLRPQISMRIIGTKDAVALATSAKFTNLPPSAIATTEIQGYGSRTDGLPATLFIDVSHGDAAGNLSVSADGLPIRNTFKRLTMRTNVTSGNTTLYEGSRSIRIDR